MRIAAIVPTRNRAETAQRAVSSFLDALKTSGMVSTAKIIIVDDSDGEAEANLLRTMFADLPGICPWATLELVERGRSSSLVRTVASPGGGPGATRNRGLARLREIDDSDLIMMFDDDVCFTDTEYQGQRLKCDGAALLVEAITLCDRNESIVGCGYVGRQDLSILEHARLAGSHASDLVIAPAIDRATVENVAPAGISTAFLTIRATARSLPDFPEHYNEDYVWLHALNRAGWRLNLIDRKAVHAPPGHISLTAPALSFEIFGEIVWLAVLETARFPLDDPVALAGAVEEIIGDLRQGLADCSIRGNASSISVLSEVIAHYELLAVEVAAGFRTPTANALRRAIARGLYLSPYPGSFAD